MNIKLKCFASLVDSGTCDFNGATEYNMVNGQTIADLVEVAGLDPKEIKIAFLNNRKVDIESKLSDGDRVGLSPAVGGM